MMGASAQVTHNIDRGPFQSNRHKNYLAGIKGPRSYETIDEVFNDNPFCTPHPDGPVPPVLFHGTDRTFEVGDIIRPRSKKVAHATASLATARVFGRACEGRRVYEVEPLNQSTTWTRQMKHTGGEVHFETLAEEGFRVRRLVE